MSSGLLVSRKMKLELYHKFLISRNYEDESKYKNYRNLYNKVLKSAKKMYFESKLESNKNEPKKLWATLNEILNRSSSKSSIDKVSVNGKLIDDAQNMANEFNSFFSEIAENILKDIPESTAKPEDYLTDSGFNFELGQVDPSEIIEIVKSLKSKSSLDIDGLNSKLLKSVITEIAVPLSFIFNLSFDLGQVPESFKVSRTCPVFKSGNPEELTNYRPISCLPVLSKIIEKIVFKRLYSFLANNKLLYRMQFGFQPGKSTFQPILNIVNFISAALNDNKIAVATFLDFRKAFDVVNHDILLLKLNKIGVKNVNLKWFKSYLSNRKQFVMVNNVLSDLITEFNVSVPQGSILGPLLFLIYINDMYKSNLLSNFHFADDSTGLAKGSNIVEVGNFVNTELQKLGMWLRANKICVNTSKTKVMVFHLKQTSIPDFQFYFNNNDINSSPDLTRIFPIERISKMSKVPAFKMLGIYFDENLSFDYHIKQTRNKVSKSIFYLNRAKNILTGKALKSLYFALIHPHILYCLPIYSCSSKSNINSLYLLQKKCVRIISKASYNSHSQPLFSSLDILPLPDLIIQQQLLIMHSIDQKYSTVNYDGFFLKNSALTDHPYPLRNADDFFLPRVRNDFLKKFPFFCFPLLWNDFDPNIKQIESKLGFKLSVKKFLLDKYLDFRCDKLYCFSCSNT